jgi:hypothetical protein
MSDPVRFTLRIEGLTPEDLPMRRLAAYLDQFARLLGEEASTRFDGVCDGSARLIARALPVAVPKVRTRLAAARDDVQSEGHALINDLDEMMTADNASGTLSEEDQPAVIIHFPGIKARAARLPPVTEAGAIQGFLIRLGGSPRDPHATLRDGDRQYRCAVSLDLALKLREHLYGPRPIRLHGHGRWRRTPDGTWELTEGGFRASHFEPLDPLSLPEAAEKLRAAGGFGLGDEAEMWNELAALRGDD